MTIEELKIINDRTENSVEIWENDHSSVKLNYLLHLTVPITENIVIGEQFRFRVSVAIEEKVQQYLNNRVKVYSEIIERTKEYINDIQKIVPSDYAELLRGIDMKSKLQDMKDRLDEYKYFAKHPSYVRLPFPEYYELKIVTFKISDITYVHPISRKEISINSMDEFKQTFIENTLNN